MEGDGSLQGSKLWQLHRVYNTVIKMLNNRKYVVSEQIPTLEDFATRFGNDAKEVKGKLMMQCKMKNDATERLLVFFPTEEKLDVNGLKKYAEIMQAQKVNRSIMVVESDMSPFAKKAIAEAQPMYYIEVFKESELMVDITEHELVPKHEVLSQEEKEQLMIRYNLKDSQLPRMFPTDPISRYFGLARGQVVKIIRSSETAGRYVTYRIVY